MAIAIGCLEAPSVAVHKIRCFWYSSSCFSSSLLYGWLGVVFPRLSTFQIHLLSVQAFGLHIPDRLLRSLESAIHFPAHRTIESLRLEKNSKWGGIEDLTKIRKDYVHHLLFIHWKVDFITEGDQITKARFSLYEPMLAMPDNQVRFKLAFKIQGLSVKQNYFSQSSLMEKKKKQHKQNQPNKQKQITVYPSVYQCCINMWMIRTKGWFWWDCKY